MASLNKPREMPDAQKDRIWALGMASIWYTQCRKCKAPLRGTFQQLRAHICGQESQASTEPPQRYDECA